MIPAKEFHPGENWAGIQRAPSGNFWIPAFAGMTKGDGFLLGWLARVIL
jgi:hypothetical protein